MNDTDIKPALTPEEWKGVADIQLLGDKLREAEQTGTGYHGLAALALHDQPFGFTWEDVAELHAAAKQIPIGRSWLEDLANRIAALLPPRESPLVIGAGKEALPPDFSEE